MTSTQKANRRLWIIFIICLIIAILPWIVLARSGKNGDKKELKCQASEACVKKSKSI